MLNEAIEVLSPSGAAYAGISANSEYPGGGYEAANLFKTDVTGLALGATIGGADWAEEGTQPAYVAFELAQDNKVRAAYYAQRTGADPSLDKITKMSVWTSSSAAFDPLNPPTDEPAASVQITDNGGAVWRRYLLPQVVTGRYFLIRVEQDPQAGGNIGGHELRLGVLVESKRLEYGRSQAGLTLTWSSGTLQQADDATGPWQAATDITPGVAIPTNGARLFYRVKY